MANNEENDLNELSPSFFCALTTVAPYENPFDPIDDFDKWYDYDVNVLGLNSSAYLARIFRDSEQFTEEERELAKEDAIDEIIKYDFLNIYRKVKKPNKA